VGETAIFFFLNGVFFIAKKIVLGYIHYTGGIQSDNSNQTYIVHYLHFPLSALSLIPLPAPPKELQEVF
jgi:hypothetical protein